MAKKAFISYAEIDGIERLLLEPEIGQKYLVMSLNPDTPAIYSYKDSDNGETFLVAIVLVLELEGGDVKIRNLRFTNPIIDDVKVRSLSLKVLVMSSIQYRSIQRVFQSEQPIGIELFTYSGNASYSTYNVGAEKINTLSFFCEKLKIENCDKYYELQDIEKNIKRYLETLKGQTQITSSDLKRVFAQTKASLYFKDYKALTIVEDTEANSLFLGDFELADWVPSTLTDQRFKDTFSGVSFFFEGSCVCMLSDKTLVPAVIFARISQAKSKTAEIFSYVDVDVFNNLTDFRTDSAIDKTVLERVVTLESFVYGCLSRGLLSIYDPCMQPDTATLENFKLAAYACLSKPVGFFRKNKKVKKKENQLSDLHTGFDHRRHVGMPFKDGEYIVGILDMYLKENRHGLQFVVMDCRVEESSNPQVPVGLSLTWICKIQGSDAGVRDLQVQLAGILNCHSNQITPKLQKELLTPDVKTGLSPLAGTRCYAYARDVSTRAGATFTKVEFRGLKDHEGGLLRNFIKPETNVANVDQDPVNYDKGFAYLSNFETVLPNFAHGSVIQRGRLKISQPYLEQKTFELTNKHILSSEYLKKMMFINKNRNVEKVVAVSLLEPFVGGCVISVETSHTYTLRLCKNVEDLEKEGDYFFDQSSGFGIFYAEGGLGQKLPVIFDGCTLTLVCPKTQVSNTEISHMHFLGIPRVGSEVFFDENFHFTVDVQKAKTERVGYVVSTKYCSLFNSIELVFDMS